MKPGAKTPEPITDALEKGPKRTGSQSVGAKLGRARAEARDFTVHEAIEPELAGKKDAERLAILSRSPLFQTAQTRWLEKLMMKLQVTAPPATRRLGFGPWKKKYESKAALVEALQAVIAPLFAKAWGVALPAFVDTGDEMRWRCELAEIPGEPRLHPAYLSDASAYELVVNQDDIKHVCHGYVCALGHAYVRTLVARKRELGIAPVAQDSGLSPEHLYVLECNLVQHYVPSSLSAYFEHQPMRALAREVANGFRKLAFGGQ